MTGQQFTELVENIKATKGTTHIELAKILKISRGTLSYWKKHGVPVRRVNSSNRRIEAFLKGAVLW